MRLLIISLFFINFTVFGQKDSGLVLSSKDRSPVKFVNIGIVGKNTGTTSDEHGKYKLFIDRKFDNDSIKFSCIGFQSVSMKVSDYRKLSDKNISLEEKPYTLNEVVVYPKKYKEITLGYVAQSKLVEAGYCKNDLGYECGVLLKIKKSAIIERLNLDIVGCSYDTLFYRINVYKVLDKMTFENILPRPIYIKIPKSKIKDEVSINLLPYHILVHGDCLITVEFVKNLGKGGLYFGVCFPGRTYIRETSQGNLTYRAWY